MDKKVLDIQCPSTKALLMAQLIRPLEDDYEYIKAIKLTPVKMEAQLVKEDGTVDLNVREITRSEYDLHDRNRQHAGARLEHFRGDKPISTITADRKERAEGAFMRTLSVAALKARFKEFMKDIITKTHAEIMADAIKKAKDEK